MVAGCRANNTKKKNKQLTREMCSMSATMFSSVCEIFSSSSFFRLSNCAASDEQKK